MPRIVEYVEKHPDIRRYREFCFGKSPADVCKLWRHEKGQGKGKGQGHQAAQRPQEDEQEDQVDPTTRVLEKLADLLGNQKGGRKKYDPEDCPKYCGVGGSFVPYRKQVVNWMYECLAHKVKWEELYSLWRKSLDDRHGEMPNPKSLVTEYEKAVREQFGIPTPEHKLLIFRCVWEELDASLLPETRQ